MEAIPPSDIVVVFPSRLRRLWTVQQSAGQSVQSMRSVQSVQLVQLVQIRVICAIRAVCAIRVIRVVDLHRPLGVSSEIHRLPALVTLVPSLMSGTIVWIPVADTPAWVRAVVEGDSTGDTVTVKRQDNGSVVTLPAAEFAEVPMENAVDAVPLEDLTQLADVHDATMLDTLRRRYADDHIYTAIGPVIISINPYKSVPSCSAEAICTHEGTHALARRAARAEKRTHPHARPPTAQPARLHACA